MVFALFILVKNIYSSTFWHCYSDIDSAGIDIRQRSPGILSTTAFFFDIEAGMMTEFPPLFVKMTEFDGQISNYMCNDMKRLALWLPE